MKRYVWLEIGTGKFSNSWDEETHNRCFKDQEELVQNCKKNPTWKLITYECLSDNDFEFNRFMKIK